MVLVEILMTMKAVVQTVEPLDINFVYACYTAFTFLSRTLLSMHDFPLTAFGVAILK